MASKRAAGASKSSQSKKQAPEKKGLDTPKGVLELFNERMASRTAKRRTPGPSGAQCEEFEQAVQASSARKAHNEDTVNKAAAVSFKRWQEQLYGANVVRVESYYGDGFGDNCGQLYYRDAAVPADKQWVLCIGPAAGARAGWAFEPHVPPVVPGLDPRETPWNVFVYRTKLSTATPVLFFAADPLELWPKGGPRETAILLASGVRFDVYHRSSPHPVKTESIGAWTSWSFAPWASASHFEQVYGLAENDAELFSGLDAVTVNIMNKDIDKIKQELESNESAIKVLERKMHVSKQRADFYKKELGKLGV